MVDLLSLEPTRISRNLKGKFILLYGEPKIGKTTFLSKIPKVLILSFEPGTNAIQGVYAQPIQSWSDFKAALAQLRSDALREKFDIIGIDTADMAYDMCMRHICNDNDVTNIGDIPYGAGYDLLKKEFSGSFNQLAYLGYGMVFISHSTEKKVKDERGEEYSQIYPAMPPRAYDIINKLVDIIGYIRNVKDPANNKRVTKIFLRGDDRFWAGSRYKYIEPVVDFSYDNVAQAIYDAIDKEIEASGGKISDKTEEFNPYFNLSYTQLMDEAKQLWLKLTNGNAEIAKTIIDKAVEITGLPGIRISEIKEEQVDKLAELVDFMKTL